MYTNTTQKSTYIFNIILYNNMSVTKCVLIFLLQGDN